MSVPVLVMIESDVTVFAADVPYRPEPPLVTVASTKSLIVTWFLPRSCGARLKRIVVQVTVTNQSINLGVDLVYKPIVVYRG